MRRLLAPNLSLGPTPLPSDQAHHARDVLRLPVGEVVELFTPDGRTGIGPIATVSAASVVVDVTEIRDPAPTFALTIASAVPKAARADWMIEKLSELGVARFVPLITDRSVVHPEGKGKIDRWQRLAVESAKQCRRAGVMAIDPLTPLTSLLRNRQGASAYLSTAPGAQPPSSILNPPFSPLTLLIGPEGGWSDGELAGFAEHHLTPITLGATILRVETAAIAAAAIVAALTLTPLTQA
jgi:16S rRNA (uracil1498-N3)-methyltransferase